MSEGRGPGGAPGRTSSDQPTLLRLDSLIRGYLDDAELTYERVEDGSYLVKLEGQHKLATMTWLVVGDHSLQVEAFVVRRPDENAAEFYRWLLARNARTYAVAFSVDHHGDVFLTGHVPLAALDEDELDRVLGSVLTWSDESFDTLLELGFASSIRKEWAWRLARGENTANLRAFAKFAEPAGDEEPAARPGAAAGAAPDGRAAGAAEPSGD